jgi:phage gp45-like
MKGQVDPESGSTQGQSFPPLMTNEDKQKMIEAKASKMAQSEVKMGTGGNVIINSGKHLIFGAGTTPAAFDSGFVNPVGRKVTNGMKYDSEKKALVEKFTAVPTFQERDTFSHMPFGNISFNGNTRITMNAGAGGILMSGAGQMKMLGTGLTHIAGQQLNLIGMGTTNVDTKALEVNASGVTSINSPETHVVGNTNIVGNLHVKGDLVVDGNITCTGNVQINGNTNIDGTTHSVGDITCDGDIIASGISMLKHVHPQNNGNDAGGGVDTSVAK